MAKIIKTAGSSETNASVWLNVAAVTPSGAEKALGGIPLDSERASAFAKQLAELVKEHGEDLVKEKLDFTVSFRVVSTEGVDELTALFA